MRATHRLALLATPLVLVTACGGGGTAATTGPADSYPERTVRFVVPYSAGGPTDLGARALMPCFESKLGGTWVVENRPGGAGAPGMTEIAGAKPDGYTIGVGSQSTFVTTPLLAEGAGYTQDSFTHVGQMMEFPSVWFVHRDSPYKTMEDLLEAAKTQPVTVGTSGAQVSFSLATQQLASQGYKFTVVPFQGTAEANTAVLGKNVDARWEAAEKTTLQMLEDGNVRPLATGADEELSFLPGVPTLKDSGVQEAVLETRTFYGVAGPEGMDQEITRVLADTLETCVKEDETYRSTIGESYAQYATGEDLLDRLNAYGETVSAIVGK